MRINTNKITLGLCCGMATLASILIIAIVYKGHQKTSSEKPSPLTTFTFPPEAETAPITADTIPILAGDSETTGLPEKASIPYEPIEARPDTPDTAKILPPVETPVYNTYVRQRGNGIVSAFIRENAPFVMLRATPDTGYRFNGWYHKNELISGDTHLRLMAGQDNNVLARFSPQTHVIGCVAAGNGTASGGGPYKHGSPVRLTATPARGYDFTGWYENGNKISPARTYDIQADQDRSLEARFSDMGLRHLCAKIHDSPNTLRSAGVDRHNITLRVNKLSLLNDSLFLMEIETMNHAKETVSLSPAIFTYKAQDIKGSISTKVLAPIYTTCSPPVRIEGKNFQTAIYVFDLNTVPTGTDIDIEQSKDTKRITYKLRKNTINKVKDIL